MRHRIHLKAVFAALLLFGVALPLGCSRTSPPINSQDVESQNAEARSKKPKVAKLSQNATPEKIKAQPSAEPAGYEFAEPVRIKAGDEFVSVESPGYACPTMADVDGDGLDDLVVGQFRSGHMQFCKNVASASSEPKFAAAEWIMTGEERAEVPGVS